MFLSEHQTGEVLGYISATFSTLLFIPQVVRICKTRDTRSISPSYLSLEILSSLTNLGYGILINEYPIIISSSSILLCNLIITYGKVYFIPRELETALITIKPEYNTF
jgi:MtN3 and saliva related transmembrane protein